MRCFCLNVSVFLCYYKMPPFLQKGGLTTSKDGKKNIHKWGIECGPSKFHRSGNFQPLSRFLERLSLKRRFQQIGGIFMYQVETLGTHQSPTFTTRAVQVCHNWKTKKRRLSWGRGVCRSASIITMPSVPQRDLIEFTISITLALVLSFP